jgi:DNA repair exonuclease SbcCD ATPase subunit
MTIDWRQSYNDLCNEIEILDIRAQEINDEMRYIRRMMQQFGPQTKLVASYEGMPGGETKVTTFDKIEQVCTNIHHLETQLEEINDILSLKREARERMEERMGQFEGLEHQVYVMHVIQRKPLNNIAADLGYSYEWIRKISMKVKNRFKVNAKQGTIREQIG